MGFEPYKLGNKAKEIFCITCVVPVFEKVCPEVYNKLRRYIHAIVGVKFVEDMSTLTARMTKSTIEFQTLANTLARASVNHDVYRENSNLITALMNAMISDTNNAKAKVLKNARVKEREDFSASTTDESNQSQFEVNSIVSNLTADVPIFGLAYYQEIARAVMGAEDLPLSTCKKYGTYISNSNITISPICKLVLQTIFSRHFIGNANIAYLRLKEVSLLVGTAQYLCTKLGLINLAHALTAKKNGRIKTENNDKDRAILLGYAKIPEYKKIY